MGLILVNILITVLAYHNGIINTRLHGICFFRRLHLVSIFITFMIAIVISVILLIFPECRVCSNLLRFIKNLKNFLGIGTKSALFKTIVLYVAIILLLLIYAPWRKYVIKST